MEKHDKENIALAGIVGFTMLAGALLTIPNTLADDVVDVIIARGKTADRKS